MLNSKYLIYIYIIDVFSVVNVRVVLSVCVGLIEEEGAH